MFNQRFGQSFTAKDFPINNGSLPVLGGNNDNNDSKSNVSLLSNSNVPNTDTVSINIASTTGIASSLNHNQNTNHNAYRNTSTYLQNLRNQINVGMANTNRRTLVQSGMANTNPTPLKKQRLNQSPQNNLNLSNIQHRLQRQKERQNIIDRAKAKRDSRHSRRSQDRKAREEFRKQCDENFKKYGRIPKQKELKDMTKVIMVNWVKRIKSRYWDDMDADTISKCSRDCVEQILLGIRKDKDLYHQKRCWFISESDEESESEEDSDSDESDSDESESDEHSDSE